MFDRYVHADRSRLFGFEPCIPVWSPGNLGRCWFGACIGAVPSRSRLNRPCCETARWNPRRRPVSLLQTVCVVLGWLGARVTKIESPNGGDCLRFTPPLTPAGDGVWFTTLNAGKESVSLDLKKSAHKAALEALIAGTMLVEISGRG